jgi:cell pole-organizing protein PopZ
MSEPNVQEPTMEEILASIRRIISEDEPAAEAAPAEAAPAEAPEPMAAEAIPVEAEEVLELTDPLPEPEPAPAVVETHGDLEVHQAEPEPEPEPERELVRAPEPVPAALYDDEPLVSEPTEDETASSFGHLARSVAMPKGGRNLEDVVAELLRPLLKAWLDEHLPAIVQAKVEEEVERIARRRVS